jgi:hypothetical protein
VEAVRAALVAELEERGVSVHHIPLREVEASDCVGCFGCWVRTPGVCVQDDAGRGIPEAMMDSDVTVGLTPVVFGGPSYHLKKALDRIIGLTHPFFTRINGEIHHKPRYARYPNLMFVGVLPEEDERQRRIFVEWATRVAIDFHPQKRAVTVVRGDRSPATLRCELGSLLPLEEVPS